MRGNNSLTVVKIWSIVAVKKGKKDGDERNLNILEKGTELGTKLMQCGWLVSRVARSIQGAIALLLKNVDRIALEPQKEPLDIVELVFTRKLSNSSFNFPA